MRRVTIEFDRLRLDSDQLQSLGEAMATLTTLAKSEAITMTSRTVRRDKGATPAKLMPITKRVLQYMVEHHGTKVCTVTELADGMHLTPMTVRANLHILHLTGHIQRHPDFIVKRPQNITGWSVNLVDKRDESDKIMA